MVYLCAALLLVLGLRVSPIQGYEPLAMVVETPPIETGRYSESCIEVIGPEPSLSCWTFEGVDRRVRRQYRLSMGTYVVRWTVDGREQGRQEVRVLCSESVNHSNRARCTEE